MWKLLLKEEFDKFLQDEPVRRGKRTLAALKEADIGFNVLEDTEVNYNEAEVHVRDTDLWECLSVKGTLTFILGGELIDPRITRQDSAGNPLEYKARAIRGGTTVEVKAGDHLKITVGVPHQHQCSGTARLKIIKIPKDSRG